MNNEEEFENIIHNTGIRKWIEEKLSHEMTLMDLYEGLAMLSSVQADVNHYLKAAQESMITNIKSKGRANVAFPQLTTKQIASLMNIFESSLIFLEDDVELD